MESGINIQSGSGMYALMKELFPIFRSITGSGVRKSLGIIKNHIPIEIHEVPSGTKAFDWEVPREWNITQAYIEDDSGKRIVDIQNHNLHVVGYSIPIDQWLDLEELQPHLHSIEKQPDAIPYITSYYKENWGFCLTHNQRVSLRPGKYHVKIDSKLEQGALTYADLVLPGESEQEVLISTYICHPSMANNELSGPVVTTAIANWLKSLSRRRYTYRIVFIPETIGSLVYLTKHRDHLVEKVCAGFVISCVGDDGPFSYLATPYADTYTDRVVSSILDFNYPRHIKYSFLERGSDERQYCSPGTELPVVGLSRSKYECYPEYHTSLDNLNFVSAEGLESSLHYLKDCIQLLEENRAYKATCLGEPNLGKRGLYPTSNSKTSWLPFRNLLNFLAYADGRNDLIKMSSLLKVSPSNLYPIVKKLMQAGLIEAVDNERVCNEV